MSVLVSHSQQITLRRSVLTSWGRTSEVQIADNNARTILEEFSDLSIKLTLSPNLANLIIKVDSM